MGAVQPLTTELRNDFPSAWTPDSRAVIFHSDRLGKFDIFRQALDQATAEPLVLGTADEMWAVVTPDGASLLYWIVPRDSKAPMRLARAPLAGGVGEVVLTAPQGSSVRCGVSSSFGTGCLLAEGKGNRWTLYELDPVRGRGAERLSLELSRETLMQWSLSADGVHVAVAQFHTEENRIWLGNLRTRQIRPLSLAPYAGFFQISWASPGDALYLHAWTPRTESLLLRADLRGNVQVLQTVFGVLTNVKDYGPMIPSPDGRHLALTLVSRPRNVWLIENF